MRNDDLCCSEAVQKLTFRISLSVLSHAIMQILQGQGKQKLAMSVLQEKGLVYGKI